VRRGHKDASQGVGVSEGAFFILIDGIKKALDLTRLRGAFRGVEPRSYWMSSKKMKKTLSETPTPWDASLCPLLTGSGFVFRFYMHISLL